MNAITISERDARTAANALIVASLQYRQDAKDAGSNSRLAEQFNKQADEAAQLAASLEDRADAEAV